MRVALLAAGRGQRLYPITENTPKPLVLVAGKPFIVHTLINLQRFGLNRIIIVTGKNKLEFRKTLENFAHNNSLNIKPLYYGANIFLNYSKLTIRKSV